MFKKASLVVFTVALSMSGAACKKKSGEDIAAKQREFQERQRAQAVKAYEELATKYPDSEHAAKARERLSALQAPKK